MSYSFSIRTESLWSPALKVGQIYISYVAALEAIYGLSAGINQVSEDSVSLEGDTFAGFIENLWDASRSSSHVVLEYELRPVLLPGIVMLERAAVDPELMSLESIRTDLEECRASMPR